MGWLRRLGDIILFGSPARLPPVPPRVKRCAAIKWWWDPGARKRADIVISASAVPNGSRIMDDQHHPMLHGSSVVPRHHDRHKTNRANRC